MAKPSFPEKSTKLRASQVSRQKLFCENLIVNKKIQNSVRSPLDKNLPKYLIIVQDTKCRTLQVVSLSIHSANMDQTTAGEVLL